MDHMGSEFIDGVRRSSRIRGKTTPNYNSKTSEEMKKDETPKLVKEKKVSSSNSAKKSSTTSVAKTATSVAKTASKANTVKTSQTPTNKKQHPVVLKPIQELQIKPTQQIRRARSLGTMNVHQNRRPYLRKYRSLSLSSNDQNSLLKPSEVLNYRLKNYEYLQTINGIKYPGNMKYYLKIQNLLAKIENKATGIVCLSSNYGKEAKVLKMAVKIAENKQGDSLKEIYILQQMIAYVQKGYHNLPIIFSAFNKIKKSELIKYIETTIPVMKGIKSFLKDEKNYNVYANELADGGDLENFLNSYDEPNSTINQNIFLNAVAQIIMSIASLHNIGIRHNDTHFGNFLYHKITPGGYIKYTINNKSYYVKNLGYLWVIWDFGISTQLNGPYDYFNDYEMLSLFLRKDEGKYNMHFVAKNEKGKLIRRNHGNLNFQNKSIPKPIVNLTELIYNFSFDKKRNARPDIPIDRGNYLLNSKDSKDKQELQDLSMSTYRLADEKNNNIYESEFITKYLMNTFPSHVFEEKTNVKDEDILFHVDLKLEGIKFIQGSNGKSDYEQTKVHYDGIKIILPEIFYQ